MQEINRNPESRGTIDDFVDKVDRLTQNNTGGTLRWEPAERRGQKTGQREVVEDGKRWLLNVTRDKGKVREIEVYIVDLSAGRAGWVEHRINWSQEKHAQNINWYIAGVRNEWARHDDNFAVSKRGGYFWEMEYPKGERIELGSEEAGQILDKVVELMGNNSV